MALDRIAADLPDVKLVVLVRDPGERAYSAHAHEAARGYEDLSFAAALEAEEGRLDGEVERLLGDPAYESHAHRHQAYRSRGEYAVQLERAAASWAASASTSSTVTASSPMARANSTRS